MTRRRTVPVRRPNGQLAGSQPVKPTEPFIPIRVWFAVAVAVGLAVTIALGHLGTIVRIVGWTMAVIGVLVVACIPIQRWSRRRWAPIPPPDLHLIVNDDEVDTEGIA